MTLNFERPDAYVPEATLTQELKERRKEIWGDLLIRIGELADNLPDVQAPDLPFRMADFASFGWKVYKLANGDDGAAKWVDLLQRLERSQANFASEGDLLTDTIRIALEREGSIGPVSTGELYRTCKKIAEQESMHFFKSAQNFGRRLSSARRALEIALGVSIYGERDRSLDDARAARKSLISHVDGF